jgi:hypothetical protein
MNMTTRLTFLDRIMMAITFAEAGEDETVRNGLMTHNRKQQRRKKTAEKRPTLEL